MVGEQKVLLLPNTPVFSSCRKNYRKFKNTEVILHLYDKIYVYIKYCTYVFILHYLQFVNALKNISK